jgi:hypothetical protein
MYLKKLQAAAVLTQDSIQTQIAELERHIKDYFPWI